MTPAGRLFDVHLAHALDAIHAPVPLVVGACGCGRTALLMRLRDRVGAEHCQYIDVERIATTPERFFRSLVSGSRFLVHEGHGAVRTSDPRSAFDATIQFLQAAHTADGSPAVFLLDEILELRTFESFPGLRTVLPDLLAAISDSPNRFVLTTRFTHRARRLVDSAAGASRIEVHEVPGMEIDEVRQLLAETFPAVRFGLPDNETSRAVHALAWAHRGYAQALAWQMRAMAEDGVPDPLSALAALFSPGGRLNATCRFSYELRLHRARGYGALKAILEVLAEEEPLTLTAIARRLGRTPGSTKDYLSWLEDVDLVKVAAKRYRFADPLLRSWVRLYNRAEPPTDDIVAREVHRYAIERMAVPVAEPEPATVAARSRGPADIIEFD
jgi:hypothetical protein